MNFDKWTFLKLIELLFVIACLATKRVTDVEASRLFLYLQKVSREWSLLRNVTWGSVGASLADATYGGYLIITAVLFIARLAGEIPTYKRIAEYFFLGLGTLLYIILGTLELFAIDDLPPDLVDNGIIIGTLSLITAGLFLIDLAGPKAVKPVKPAQFRHLQHQLQLQTARDMENMNSNNNNPQQSQPMERQTGAEIQPGNVIIHEIRELQERNGGINGQNGKMNQQNEKMNFQNGRTNMNNGRMNGQNGRMVPRRDEADSRPRNVGQTGSPKKFNIFGKDYGNNNNSDTDEIDDTIPPKMQQHSPVWSKIRKEQYGRYNIVAPNIMYPMAGSDDERPPGGPGDPGFVQYTAKTWGQSGFKTPRPSPTPV